MDLKIVNMDKPMKTKKCHIHPELAGGDGKEFMYAIIGSRGSGKSNLLMNLLTRDDLMHKQYLPSKTKQYMFFFSPSVGVDQGLENLKCSYKYNCYDEQIVDKIIKAQKEIIENHGKRKTPRLLFVFDDCISEGAYNSNSWLEKLGYVGRHLKISCIFTSQRYKALPRGLRLNCTHFSIFPLNNTSEFDQIVEEHSNKHNRNQFIKLFKYATHAPYQFLTIDYNAPKEKRFRRNLDEVIDINNFSNDIAV
jgi:hypothetical protein